LDSTSEKISIWYGTQTRNLPVLVHFRYWALPVPVRSFTGPRTGTGLYARGPISGTGLCQFRYGHSLQKKPLFPLRGVERREGKRFSNYTGYSSFLYKYSSARKKRAKRFSKYM
jgi:hypothetical protein